MSSSSEQPFVSHATVKRGVSTSFDEFHTQLAREHQIGDDEEDEPTKIKEVYCTFF